MNTLLARLKPRARSSKAADAAFMEFLERKASGALYEMRSLDAEEFDAFLRDELGFDLANL